MVQFHNGDNYSFLRTFSGGEWKYISAIKAGGKNPKENLKCAAICGTRLINRLKLTRIFAGRLSRF